MKSPLLYVVEMLFCSGLLLAFYRLLLVRKVSFAVCRRYLVVSVFLAVVVPALDIPLYPAPTLVYPLPLIVPAPVETAVMPAGAIVSAADVAATSAWRVSGLIAVGLYTVVAFLSLGFFTLRVAAIRRLRRHSSLTDCGAYTLAEHPQVATPFSFLHTVFLGEGYEGGRREIVLCHEASHVRHRHSAERIAVELFRRLFWVNPFFWIAGRWLQEVHEWEADRDVLDAGYDLTEYRTVIFYQLFGYNPDIACGLNHSLTKKRFAMMTQFKKRRYTVLRLGAAVPVVAGMMLLCSFPVRSAAAPEPDRPVLTVHIGPDGKIVLNGRPATVGELEQLVAAEREKLSEAERTKLEVVLRAESSIPMADIDDAKTALRHANALRVRYSPAASDTEVLRMLPPDASRVPADGRVRVLVPGHDSEGGAIGIPDRNLFVVRIDGSGSIVAGQSGRLHAVSAQGLPEQVKAFVLNTADDPGMPEKRVKEIALLNGDTMNYPVSEGIVSLQVSRDTPFGKYVEVQQLIAQAFGEIRDEIARYRFGKDYISLDDAARQVVARAVPLKITESLP